MDTQNTQVHIRLWHREFWLMAIACWLLSMSVYSLIPVMPLWLIHTENFSTTDVGWAMGVFGVGIFFFGAMCSFLVQHFRRNIVCIYAVAGVTLSIACLWYVDSLKVQFVEFWVILVERFALGAAYGLAQMVLTSTLIIDTCESFQRTEANYSAAWFARFALSLGPLAGLLLYEQFGFSTILVFAASCSMLSMILIKMVSFPFRTPEETVHLISLDRFLLPSGMVLFVNLMLSTAVIGMIFSLPLRWMFYAMMMTGFFFALLAQRYVFAEAELKSEVVSGLILIIAAVIMMLTRTQAIVSYVTPLFIGFAIGIIGSRFLLFFIKLSHHCQRGTSQSMFMLSWETGIALGLFMGYTLFQCDKSNLLRTALVCSAISLVMYVTYTHNWFLKHKNR